MIHAAGISVVSPKGTALFVRRGPGSDHPGEWHFPGGRLEGNETAIQAAEREFVEEAGVLVEGEHELWTRTIAAPTVPPVETPVPGQELAALEEVDYITFLQRVDREFEPTLNYENTAWCWAPVNDPPQPLHPGCQIAIDRFGMDELGVARAIRDGRLTSPQWYENIALFDMRITGTGVSYREKLDEYVYRRPENYLTEEFLTRCNGLPVVVEHPSTEVLTTEEFAKRIVGMAVLPYIKGTDVWTISKVYDRPAARMMEQKLLSTSPAVVFRDPDVNLTVEMADGKTLLIEGKPSLVDHLAICQVGVWDKGGDPAGIIAVDVTGALKMAGESEEKVEQEEKTESRSDSGEFGQKLDKLLTHMDSLHSRMDSMEARYKKDDDDDSKSRKDDDDDSKHRKDDDDDSKSRKDDDEEDEDDCEDEGRQDGEDEGEGEVMPKDEPERVAADKGRKRHDSMATKADIDRIERMISRPMSDAEFREMSGAQAKADRVFEAFGDSAPRPLQGETLINYRIRLADALKVHSPTLKGTLLSRVAIADSTTFEVLESQIYKDAAEVARSPSTVPAGQLRMVTKRMDSGHTINTFVGEPAAWMRNFAPEQQYVSTFMTSKGGH